MGVRSHLVRLRRELNMPTAGESLSAAPSVLTVYLSLPRAHPMAKEHDYRRDAAETVELAQRASCPSDKGTLLAMEDAWLKLADRAHRIPSSHTRKVTEQTDRSEPNPKDLVQLNTKGLAG